MVMVGQWKRKPGTKSGDSGREGERRPSIRRRDNRGPKGRRHRCTSTTHPRLSWEWGSLPLRGRKVNFVERRLFPVCFLTGGRCQDAELFSGVETAQRMRGPGQ